MSHALSSLLSARSRGDSDKSIGDPASHIDAQVIDCAAVDFDLSDEQLALRDGAKDLLDGLAAPDRVRGVVNSGGGYDAELWAAMGEQGWMGVELSEAKGGLGLGSVEVAVLCEEIGRHVAPAPFLQSILASWALDRGLDQRNADAGIGGDGSSRISDQITDWVNRLAAGDAIGCVVWGGLFEAVRVERGGLWALTGRSDPVAYAPVADVAVVIAGAARDMRKRDENGDSPSVFALELGADHAPRPESAMDRTRCLGRIELDGYRAIRVGGADLASELLDRGATGTSAEMLGGADRVMEMSVEYAKDRVQFGRPIGSFQAVKHRCADMLVDVEGMRSAAYHAAWAVGSGHADASIAASTAKTWCSDASRRVMASGLQVHGGIGFTWEHDLHLYLKRAQLDQVTFGDAAYHRERLAGLLRNKVDAGESVM